MNRHAAIPMADTAPDQTPAAPGRGAAAVPPPAVQRHVYFRQPADRNEDDDYEPSACWCLHTMKNFGPDDDLVGRRECRDSGRSCYEPL